MQMPGRKFAAANGDYRYGFNGKEKDNETSGEGNQYDYGFRIYNPRLGRFLSVDPLTKEYPMLTSFAFAENQPIWAIDLDGLEKYIVTNFLNKEGKLYKTEIRGIRSIDAKNAVKLDMKNVHGKSLTDKDVYIINKLSNGKIKSEESRNLLTNSEKAIFKKAKTAKADENTSADEELPYEVNLTDAVLTKNGTFTSKEFDVEQYEFFGVVQNLEIPVKKVITPQKLNQKFSEFAGQIEPDAGTITPLVKTSAIAFANLLKDCNCKSATLMLTVFNSEGKSSFYDRKAKNGFSFGENVNKQLAEIKNIVEMNSGKKVYIFPVQVTTTVGKNGTKVETN